MNQYGKNFGDSDGSSTDENKRKRDGKDDTETFLTRCKKTPRTPIKGKTYDKDKNMEELMRQMMEEIKAIRQENKVFREELIEIKKENIVLKAELTEMRKKIEDMTAVEWKLEKLEREKRKNNIVITGLKLGPCDAQNMSMEIEKFIKETVKIETQVKNAYLTKGNKLIIAEMENFNKKVDIMKNKHMLRNIKGGNIYIDSDLTAKEREVQKVIRDKAKEQRREGKEVKPGYQKLEIDGTLWIWDNKVKQLITASKK